MDRCALFVDAGYALADGAMAVHGTRRRDSVSWDHAGLLKVLAGLARDRTGLPVLRCYWYETAEGRRTAEHDALAEMPGLKLRLVNARPGRREGIESQLRRDLVTLAKSGAISDAFIASADEQVAEIVADVQDLGLRVVILHIASDGGWTIPAPLRQECDDIVEISGVHLRPFVELIRGAEPAAVSDQYVGAAFGSRSGEGDSPVAAAVTHQGLPAAALPASGTAYPVSSGTDHHSGAQPYGGASAGQPYDGASAAQSAAAAAYSAAAPGPQAGAQGQAAQPHSGLPDGQAQASGLAPQNLTHSGSAAGPQAAAGHNGSTSPPGAHSTYQSGSAQHGSAQHGSAQHRSAQHGTAQHGTAQDGTGQDGTGQGGGAQNGHIQAGPVQVGPAQTGYQPGTGYSGAPGPAGAPQNGGGQHGGAAGGYAPSTHQGTGGQSGAPAGSYQNGGSNGAGQLNGHNGAASAAYQNGTGLNSAALNGRAGGPAHNGAPQNGGIPGEYQNGTGLNAPGHQNGGYQNGGYQNGAYQNGGYQNGGYQNGAYQNGYPNGGYQNGYPNGAGQSGAGQSGAGPSGAGQSGLSPAGYQAGGVPNGTAPGSYQGGSALNGTVHAGYQNGAGHDGGPQGGAVNGAPPASYQGDPQGGGMSAGALAGFEAAPTPGQYQQVYGAPDLGFGQGQPGAAGSEQQARAAFAPSQGPGGSAVFQPQAQYAAQAQQPGAQVPAVRAPQPVAISLPEAVKAAHAEGFTFGESVGRDAPGLWLEAVLARKPRMPSDLEARLLQGSVLPIDSLLHDEVRHSLRRGFWDALESARR